MPRRASWLLLLVGPSLGAQTPPGNGQRVLRWENVEGAPYWVDGVAPVRSLIERAHVFRLRPGDQTRLLLEGSSTLRVTCLEGRLQPDDLEAGWSEGLGIEAPLAPLSPAKALALLYRPRVHRPVVVRLARPAAARSAIEIVLHVSHQETVDALGGFFEVQPAAAQSSPESVTVRTPRSPLGMSYWRCGGRPAAFDVEGPAEVAVVTRCQYPTAETEQRRSYLVGVRTNGKLLRQQVETLVDTREPSWIDSQPVSLGLERVVRLSIEAGIHRIEVELPPDVLIRVLRRAEDSFLLHEPPARPAREGKDGILARLAPGALSGNELELAMRCRDILLSLEDDRELRNEAGDLFRQLTRYRCLSPATPPSDGGPLVGWLTGPRLLAPAELPADVYLDERLVRDGLMGFALGVFTDVPASAQDALLYDLPPRRSETLLRLAVLRDEVAAPGAQTPVVLWLELEGETPLRLSCDFGATLPRSRFQPSMAEAALAAALRGRTTMADPDVLARWSRARAPLPVLDAAMLEVPVPAGVRAVRVWCPDVQTPPRISLQVLEGNSYRLTEQEFRDARHTATGNELLASVFVSRFRAWLSGEWPRDPAMGRLVMHWTPLFRLLRAASDRFRDGTPKLLSKMDSEEDLLDEASRQERRAAVLQLESEGEWLLAYEAWSRLARSADVESREAARLRQGLALLEVGERYLGQILIRSLYRYGEEEAIRREARDRLLVAYQIAEDRDSIVQLIASELTAGAGTDLLRHLVEALLDDGEHALALDTALLLPPDEVPPSILVRLAGRAGWWDTHNAAVARLSESERVSWDAWKLAREGDAKGAQRILESGGEGASAALRRLQGMVEARDSLRSLDREQRRGAITPWERAQAPEGAGELWAEDPSLVVDHAGVVLAYSPNRAVTVQLHRSKPERPVRLRVVGPTRLRFELRPVHSAKEPGTVEGWALVRWRDALQPVAITGNLVAGQLEIVNDPELALGDSVTTDVSLEEGLHDIEVASPSLELLVRAKRVEEELPMGILPPLTRGAIAALMQDPHYGLEATVEYPSRVSCLVGGTWMAPAPIVSLACGGSRATALAAEAEAWLRVRDIQARVGISSRTTPADLLGQGNYTAVLDGAWDESPAGLRQRMTTLLYIAEHDLYLARRARAEGEALFEAHRGVPGLQSLHARLVAGTEWRRIAAVRQSAGVRAFAADAWAPESVDLRVRCALLPALQAHERLLVGDNVIGVSFDNQQPSRVRVDMRLETLEHLPATDITVRWQVDGEQSMVTTLSRADGPHLSDAVSIHLTLPEGQHAIRMWADPPIVNHFVRIGCHATPEGSGEATERPVAAGSSRTYFVARPGAPLQMAVEGPTTLQIHELRDGLVRSRRHTVPVGWQEIVLEAPPGREEGLFRVFERVESRAPRVAHVRVRPPPRVRASDEQPLVFQPLPTEPPLVVIDERGAEDGTVSLDASLNRRRVFEEDDTGDDDPVHYFELGAEHRAFLPGLSAYFDSRVLGRLFESTGPTLGAIEDVVLLPRWLGFGLRLTGTAFVQWPEGDTWSPAGEPQWSTSLRGSIYRVVPVGASAYSLPSLALFGRILSLDSLGDLDASDVDPDIFTPYKAEHQLGWTVSDKVGYFPWRDTEWWGRASLTSNETLNPGTPDNVAAQAGWSQFANGWLLDLTYRYTHFFNDDDREEAVDRHALSLEVRKELWLGPRYRLEAGAQVRHDFPDDVTTGFVFLSWQFTRGRGYRDHAPGEVPFRELREELIPWQEGDP